MKKFQRTTCQRILLTCVFLTLFFQALILYLQEEGRYLNEWKPIWNYIWNHSRNPGHRLCQVFTVCCTRPKIVRSFKYIQSGSLHRYDLLSRRSQWSWLAQKQRVTYTLSQTQRSQCLREDLSIISCWPHPSHWVKCRPSGCSTTTLEVIHRGKDVSSKK